MSKFRVPVSETKLDPFQNERQAEQLLGVKPQQSVDPYQGYGKSNLAETFSGVDLQEGFSLFGNSSKAASIQNETLYNDQGALELLAKGVGRTLSKAGTEILKLPGYVGGLAMAGGNELLGDGKGSIALAVDNAWINHFESLDQNLKDMMPVHISQDIQEGG